MSEPIIEVRDLRKVYRAGDVEIHALRGVNLTVEAGELLCVVGRRARANPRCSTSWAG